jgi:hypothetical protein
MTPFITTTGEEVKISNSGVVTGGIVVGYTAKNHLDYSIGLLIANSYLMPGVDNASASFHKVYLNPIIKYILETRDETIDFNFGIGLILTNQPMLDIDGSEVSGGGHNQYVYKNAMGPTFSFEFQNGPEALKGFILKFYAKYTILTYKLKTALMDGINWPLDQLPVEVQSEVIKLKANGFEVGLGLAFRIPLNRNKK